MTIKQLLTYEIFYTDSGYISIIFQNKSDYTLFLDKNFIKADIKSFGKYNLRTENGLGYEIRCKKHLEKLYL